MKKLVFIVYFYFFFSLSRNELNPPLCIPPLFCLLLLSGNGDTGRPLGQMIPLELFAMWEPKGTDFRLEECFDLRKSKARLSLE